MAFANGTHAYLGFRGAEAVALVFDDPGYEKDTAKTIASWVRKGLTIERLLSEQACARLKQDWEKRKAALPSAE